MTGQSETFSSGIYALINLDGAPIDAADAFALGLNAGKGPIAALARDDAQPLAINQRVTRDEVTLFAGFLDEAENLASRLGLSEQADHLSIALAAWRRFGDDMPYHALGEWSLLLWRAGEGVDLVSSMPRRDRLCFARVGSRVAIAPGIWALAQLPWVGDALDDVGFRFAMMPFQVRQEAGLATPLRNVRQLPFGGSVRITAGGERVARARSWRSFEAAPFGGNQREAVGEAEALLRRSMRQRVDRGPTHGALLSGGLDSSLLTWLLAETRGSDRPFPCITSAAPEGSGLASEVSKARTVADALGLPLHPVVPHSDRSPYRPSGDQMIFGNGSVHAARHYLYHAFAQAAVAQGIDCLFDGMFGEHTVTARYPLDTLGMRMRQLLRRMLGNAPRFSARRSLPFIRFAAHRIADMPPQIREAQKDLNEPPYRFPRPGERWLFVPGDSMRLGPPTEILAGRVRSEFPFRDIRLWRLFASFPTEFALHGGLVRAPVRLMLEGRLPDSIRMQPKGLGISPDYFVRLQAHALAQVERIPLLRRADVDDWIDLDWLDANLRRVAAQGVSGIEDAGEVQLTAMNAEMLYWWRTGRGSTD